MVAQLTNNNQAARVNPMKPAFAKPHEVDDGQNAHQVQKPAFKRNAIGFNMSQESFFTAMTPRGLEQMEKERNKVENVKNGDSQTSESVGKKTRSSKQNNRYGQGEASGNGGPNY